MSSQDDLLGPVGRYRHDHPPVRNVLSEHRQSMSRGQRVADRVTAVVGSWPFILIQTGLLAVWIAFNVYLVVMEKAHPGFLRSWDPYPFILLNLVLSFQAAYTGPVVMMSQNRISERDRLIAQHDYEINLTTEREIQVVMDHLAHQDRLLVEAMRRVEALPMPPSTQPTVERLDALLKRLEQNDRRITALMERVGAASAA